MALGLDVVAGWGTSTWTEAKERAGSKEVDVSMKTAMEMLHVSADQGRIFRKSLESLLACCALVLGIQFIGFGWTEAQVYSTLYLPMQIVAGALVWGWLFTALGVIRLLVLIVNGKWMYTYTARKWLSLAFIACVWLPMGSCFFWGFWHNILLGKPVTYPGVAYGLMVIVVEYLVYYALATFVSIRKRA